MEELLAEIRSIKERLTNIEHDNRHQSNSRPNYITNNPRYMGQGSHQGQGRRRQPMGRREGDSVVYTRRRLRGNSNITGGYHQNYRQAQNVQTPNPESDELSQLLYKSCQLRHHAKNWAGLPKSIGKQFDNIFKNIVPPAPNPQTTAELQKLNNECKSNLVAIILDHISKAHEKVNEQIRQADARGFDTAASDARSELLDHFGKKIKIYDVNNWLAEDLQLIEGSTNYNRVHQTATHAGANWTTETRRYKRPASSLDSPVQTANRFEVLNEEEGFPADDSSFPSLTAKTAPRKSPQSRTNPPKKTRQGSRSPLRPNQMRVEVEINGDLRLEQEQEQEEGPENIQAQPMSENRELNEVENHLNVNATTQETQNTRDEGQTTSTIKTHADRAPEGATGTRMETIPETPPSQLPSEPAEPTEQEVSEQPDDPPSNSRVTIHHGPKNAWRASPKEDTTVLVIGDSNLRLTRSLPNDWEAHVFPGASLSHASQIIDYLTPSSTLRAIVICVGINNRGWQVKNISHDVNMVANSAAKRGISAHFLGISLPPALSNKEKTALKELNKIAKEKFRHRFIPALNDSEVSVSPTDKFNIHYDQPTVDKILQKVIDHFLVKISPARRQSL